MSYTVIWETAGHNELERQSFDDLAVARDAAESRALFWVDLENQAVVARVLDDQGIQLDILGRG